MAKAHRQKARNPGEAQGHRQKVENLAQPEQPNHWGLLVLLAVLALLYSGSLNMHGMFMWDEAEYACLARSIVRGEPYTNALRPPLLPFSGAVAMVLSGQATDSVLKSSVLVFGLLGLTVVYQGLCQQFDCPTALAAAGILGLAPDYWSHLTFYLTEIPLMVFFTCAVLLFYRGLYGGPPGCLYASWACLGLALLTRYTALLFGPLCAIFVIFALVKGDQASRATLRNKHFWLSPLIGLLLMAPWLIRSQLVHGDALGGFKIASRQLQGYVPGVSMPWHYYLSGVPEMLGWPATALLLAGVVWVVASRNRFGLHLLAVVGFLFLWFSVYRYKELRLITSVLPFLAGLSALGLTRGLGGRLPVFASTAGVAALLVPLYLLQALVFTRPLLKGTVAIGYPSFLQATDYLRERVSPGAVIMGAPVPHLSWYVDRPVVPFPNAEADLKNALAGVDWLVIVNWEKGQPAYLTEVINRAGLPRKEFQALGIGYFEDRKFLAMVLPAKVLAERLATPATPTASPSPAP